MKKTMLMFLLLCLIPAALGAGAFADDGNQVQAADSKSEVVDMPQLGLRYEAPEALRNLKGQLTWSYDYIVDGMLGVTVNYFAVSEEDSDAYTAFCEQAFEADGKETPSDPDHPVWLSGYVTAPIYDFYIINGGRGETELRELLLKTYSLAGDIFATFTEVGSDGDCRFYLTQLAPVMNHLDDFKFWMGDYFDEFEALLKDPAPFLSGLKFSSPEWSQIKTVDDDSAKQA